MSAPSNSRTARLARDSDGDPIGAAVFFTAEELADIGVDTDNTDTVRIVIEDGSIRLSAENEPEEAV